MLDMLLLLRTRISFLFRKFQNLLTIPIWDRCRKYNIDPNLDVRTMVINAVDTNRQNDVQNERGLLTCKITAVVNKLLKAQTFMIYMCLYLFSHDYCLHNHNISQETSQKQFLRSTRFSIQNINIISKKEILYI